MDADLVERLRAAAEESFAGGPVLFAYLFGSRARGRPRPNSDTDIAVLLEDGLSKDERFWFGLRVPTPLLRAARTEVDLVVLNDAPLPLRGRVIRSRVVLYSRDDALRVSYESLTLRMFLDYEILARRLDDALLTEMAAGRR